MKKTILLGLILALSNICMAQKMSSFPEKDQVNQSFFFAGYEDSAGTKINKKVRVPYREGQICLLQVDGDGALKAVSPDSLYLLTFSELDSAYANTGTGNGEVTGWIYWRKNYMTNTVHVWGLFRANDASHFYSAGFSHYYYMTALPIGLRPQFPFFFHTYWEGSPIDVKDNSSIGWIKVAESYVDNDGKIYINFMRPFGFTAWYMRMNIVVPLD